MSRNADGLLLGLLLVLANSPLLADTLPISEAIDAFSGTEVTFDGDIGYSDHEEKFLKVRSGAVIYAAQLDAGRAVRKEISGCRIFEWNGDTCRVSGSAEMRFSGNEVLLNVYELKLEARVEHD